MLLSVVVIVVAGFATAAVRVAMLPDLDDLEATSEGRLLFADITGEPLLIDGTKPSDVAGIERFPEHLLQAVIAIEDRRFYDHGGLDVRSILRAAFANAEAGSIVQGGSTITQQLVKISYLDPEETYARKFHEALLAREMEAKYSKEQILEKYLNTVYLGNGAHGVVAAARIYFGKPVEELSLAESAAIAAMIRAPSLVNPTDDPEALQQRAGTVIDAMQGAGMIDPGTGNVARVTLTSMVPRPRDPAYGGWFTDWAAARARGLEGRVRGVSTLKTTLDPDLQKLAERSVNDALGGTPMEAAMVVLRPDGTVAAMVGGRDYTKSQFNRAVQAMRQPGSTFKLFGYLAALNAGLSPDDTISDEAIDIDGYAPQNFGGNFHGTVTMREAFAKSYNAAAVRLGSKLGYDTVADTARALGIEAELSETPSLALGASGVSLIDLTEAYASVAVGRAPVEARGLLGLKTGDGEYHPFDWTDPPSTGLAERLMQQREPMTELLRAVVTDGTGTAAEIEGGAVGKTGTSQDFRDALFVGWSQDYIAGVWVGNDDNSPMDEVTGGGVPAQIWANFMRQAPAVAAGAEAQAAEPPRDAAAPAVAEIGAEPGTLEDAPAEETGAQTSDEPEAADGTLVAAPENSPEPRVRSTDDAGGGGTAADGGTVLSTDEAGTETAAAPAEPEPELEPEPEPEPEPRTSSGTATVSTGDLRGMLEDAEQAVRRGDVQGLIDTLSGTVRRSGGSCNVQACERAYRSFRASDCTFQPYGGGPRELCTR